jgi:cytidylate kinase
VKPRISDHLIDVQLHPILASVRATKSDIEHAEHGGRKAPEPPPRPFVTISRQPGAGAWTLAQRLIERLNAQAPGDPPWSCWEKELVEKVAAEHHIARELVQSLGERSRSWLEEAFAGFSTRAEYAEEYAVYRHVAQTIRALAQVGRVVIVGRGGVFVTRDMAGGIHLRLVAPLAYRVAAMARSLNIPEADAATVVREMERAREAFHHRYWPRETRAPETYTAVLNTQAIGENRLADWVADLIAGLTTARAR